MSNKLSSFKGYYGLLKGIVTRTDDPKDLSRVQVCIPSYHGKLDDSEKNIGSGEDEGEYPWAQVGTLNFKSNNEVNTGLLSRIWFTMINGDSSYSVGDTGSAVIMPDINEVVWLSFEGGDIRLPVYQGTLAGSVQDLELIGDLSMLGLSSGFIGDGSLVALAVSIIHSSEGNYDSINGNDNGAISIGKVQWHANRARDLLVSIRNANKSNFDNICSKHGASGLISALSSSWNTYIMYVGTPIYKATTEILATKESKTAQDNLAMKDIEGYMAHARERGVTDPSALIYWADLENQGGLGGALAAYNIVIKPVTLDSLHSASMKTYMSAYAARRNQCYNKIKEAERQGKLKNIGQNSSSSADTAVTKKLFAEAEKHLGKPYVFGAVGPNSFDCSSYVCYVFRMSGVMNMPRVTAQYIYDSYCTKINKSQAKRGDIIFFTNTYAAGVPVSHVGIYAGNNKMIHAGNPIQYTDITDSYWTSHFYAYGRAKTMS